MVSSDDGLARVERQLRELQAWISDLTIENRALRQRLETDASENNQSSLERVPPMSPPPRL
jgi:hypothetical protein